VALLIKIQVNATQIRGYSARRLGKKSTGWNRYLVEQYILSPEFIENTRAFIPGELLVTTKLGILRHKYEDGADVLALKVMKMVVEAKKK